MHTPITATVATTPTTAPKIGPALDPDEIVEGVMRVLVGAEDLTVDGMVVDVSNAVGRGVVGDSDGTGVVACSSAVGGGVVGDSSDVEGSVDTGSSAVGGGVAVSAKVPSKTAAKSCDVSEPALSQLPVVFPAKRIASSSLTTAKLVSSKSTVPPCGGKKTTTKGN